MTTSIWSEALFGGCEPWIKELAARRSYDLTLLCAPDVPYVPGPQRYLPDGGESFYERVRDELERLGREYVVVGGSWGERMETAVLAIDRLLAG